MGYPANFENIDRFVPNFDSASREILVDEEAVLLEKLHKYNKLISDGGSYFGIAIACTVLSFLTGENKFDFSVLNLSGIDAVIDLKGSALLNGIIGIVMGTTGQVLSSKIQKMLDKFEDNK